MILTFPRLNPVIFNERPLPSFEYYNEQFIQCWNKTDYIIFQVTYDKDFSLGDVIASLVDCDDIKIADFENEVIDTGLLYQGILRCSCNVSPGIYRIKLDSKGEQFTLYSNWLKVSDANENTLLINYGCSRNKFDCVFLHNDYRYSFLLRVHGGVKSSNVSFKSDDVNYIDQDRNIYLIDSIPYSIKKYTFGDSAGMPNWMADRLNRIFACDDVRIDGVKVVKDDGAAIETVGSDGYPYVGVNIDLLHQDEGYSETLYNDVYMQTGVTLSLKDGETSFVERPAPTGRVHVKEFEKTFN